MTLSERRRRLDARAWVYRICILCTVVAGLIAVPMLFGGFACSSGASPWARRSSC